MSSSFEFCFVISLCNRVRELSIIKISVGSRALLCCCDLEKVERTKVHMDLIDSNDFT